MITILPGLHKAWYSSWHKNLKWWTSILVLSNTSLHQFHVLHFSAVALLQPWTLGNDGVWGRQRASGVTGQALVLDKWFWLSHATTREWVAAGAIWIWNRSRAAQAGDGEVSREASPSPVPCLLYKTWQLLEEGAPFTYQRRVVCMNGNIHVYTSPFLKLPLICNSIG